MKKSIYFLFILLHLFITMSAQQITLKGRVFDRIDKEPVTGATISIKKGASNNIMGNYNFTYEAVTYTDIDGRYSLLCNKGDTLRVFHLGFDPIEWTVNEDSKNLYLEDDRNSFRPMMLEGTSTRHAISLAPVYSPANKTLGSAFSYKFSYNKNSWRNEYFHFNATYAQPVWDKDGLFFPQLIISQNLPLKINGQKHFILSGGIGYYWNVNNSFRFGSGNYAFSTNLNLWKINLYSKDYSYKFYFFAGYNWFVKQHRSDYFSIGISVHLPKRILSYD